jgi:hypothetical protein
LRGRLAMEGADVPTITHTIAQNCTNGTGEGNGLAPPPEEAPDAGRGGSARGEAGRRRAA